MNILVVEDDPNVGELLVRALKAEGQSVVLAMAAHEALGVTERQDFDVIVADVMLPDISGRELCVELRARGINTPVVMLTALDSVEDKVDGLRAGADDYLTKPFDLDELFARLEALVRRASGGQAPPSRYLVGGDIRMDLETFEVTRFGELIKITPTEFAVLQVLMEAPDKVLSRSYIVNRAWGHDDDPLTNVVDVYVRRLRKKLDLDPETGPIRSVRGHGYRFMVERGKSPAAR